MTTTPVRKFEDKPAVRESVPLLIGLMGPSGSGKTYSALRLATGIQRVVGGDIYYIDTEARRSLHYADDFKFKHIQFDPPFGSLDYLAAIRHCVAKGAKVVVIDSMSHEHTGPGGYLQTQDAEVDRMAGNDMAKRERVKMAAWIKPAHLRGQMVAGILQLNVDLIFCFRAKEKIKPKPGGNPIELGWMPIAGDELLFEMTTNILLLPKAGGVPTWRSDQIGERLMMKLPKQFESVFRESKPLDEDIGRKLAEWAKGGPAAPTSAPHSPPAEPELDIGDISEMPVDDGVDSDLVAAHMERCAAAAARGWAALKVEWESTPDAVADILRGPHLPRWKEIAKTVDIRKGWIGQTVEASNVQEGKTSLDLKPFNLEDK